MKRDLNLFIEDILENINAVEKFSQNLSEQELEENTLKQYAIIRAIEIIGEASKNIPKFFREKYPNIKWNKISGMRDVITHGYFRIDLDAVWEVIKRDIPILKKQILEIKEKESHHFSPNALWFGRGVRFFC